MSLNSLVRFSASSMVARSSRLAAFVLLSASRFAFSADSSSSHLLRSPWAAPASAPMAVPRGPNMDPMAAPMPAPWSALPP